MLDLTPEDIRRIMTALEDKACQLEERPKPSPTHKKIAAGYWETLEKVRSMKV